ncbi:MAG: hypothetical protein WCR56_05415 [Bacilli bacterium]
MTETITVSEKKTNPVAEALNNFFHIRERGGTIKSEVGAGISTFLIACVTFIMNAKIVGSYYGNYAGSYLAITLIAFVGTFLIGLLANKPLVVCSNLALSTALVSMIGANSGLTYANLMVVTFFSSLIVLTLSVSPLGHKLITFLPLSVRKALPVAVGLFTIFEGLKDSGLVSSNVLTNVSGKGLQGFYLVLMAISVLGFIAMKSFKVRKSTFRLYGLLVAFLWVGGIVFYLSDFVGGSTATTLVYERLNLIVATDGASPYNIGLGFQSIKWGQLFTSGFDFSAMMANGGNPALVFIKGLIVFTAMTTYTNVGNLEATATSGNFITDDYNVEGARRTFIIASAVNMLAPIVGAPIVTVSSRSAVATENEGKTGLSSIVTSLGFFVCLFTWAAFAFTATTTNGVGMWIEQSEVKLAAYVQDGFGFNGIIMALVGATMLKGVKKINFTNAMEIIPFIATVCGTLFTSDIAFGVTLGVIADLFTTLAMKKYSDIKTEKIVLSSLSLVYLVFALI